MDIFALRPNAMRIYKIDQKTYLEATGRRAPYQVVHPDSSESFFAVCPLCGNPIQIVGLFKNTPESGRKPYGRHWGKTIPGLAVYNRSAYLDCPYSDQFWHKSKSKQRKRDPSSVREILSFLADYFDIAIGMISQETGIRISYNKAQQMLEKYIQRKGWQNRNSIGKVNLPWVLTETADATSLFGQYILDGSPLHRSLVQTYPDIEFRLEEQDSRYIQVLKRSSGMYLDATYQFTGHDLLRSEGGEHITEHVVFRVYRGSSAPYKTIYEKDIRVDIDAFVNLCHSIDSNSPRNRRYLSIAQETISKLGYSLSE